MLNQDFKEFIQSLNENEVEDVTDEPNKELSFKEYRQWH